MAAAAAGDDECVRSAPERGMQAAADRPAGHPAAARTSTTTTPMTARPRRSACPAACGRRPAGGAARGRARPPAAGTGRAARPAGSRSRAGRPWWLARPGSNGSGIGGATLARASANIAGVLSAGPCRFGRWNSARQVTSSMSAGTPATPAAACTARPFSGAGGSSAGLAACGGAGSGPAESGWAGPVAGQRGVQQPGQVPGVGELRVVGALAGRGQGLRVRARPARRRCPAR